MLVSCISQLLSTYLSAATADVCISTQRCAFLLGANILTFHSHIESFIKLKFRPARLLDVNMYLSCCHLNLPSQNKQCGLDSALDAALDSALPLQP